MPKGKKLALPTSRQIRKVVRLALRQAKKIQRQQQKQETYKPDKTFTDKDVIRFYKRNLDPVETIEVKSFFLDELKHIFEPERLEMQKVLFDEGIGIVLETVEILSIIAIPDPADVVVAIEKSLRLFNKIIAFSDRYDVYLKTYHVAPFPRKKGNKK